MRQLHWAMMASLLGILALLVLLPAAQAQELAKRLILKDGSYQLATKWEIKGERLRYYSAEREEWEEVPNSMVDWKATEKFEKDRAIGKPAPEAVELDKELEAERKVEEARTPEVAPALRLPDNTGGMILLDTFQNQAQLIELQQVSGEVNRNLKGNILRSAINPIASSKQNIELMGPHAKVQVHATLPAVYVNVAQQDKDANAYSDQPQQSPQQTQPAPELQQPQQPQQPQAAEQPWDRFRIVRVQSKPDKRIVGDLKIAPYGKVSQESKMVETTAERLTGGWVKVTPKAPLTPGEYAVVEMLGTDGMNLFVWDFGVNPSAPANPGAWKPDLAPAGSSAEPKKH